VFQEANGGTLLLDEVGELPESLQTRLLRVLETGRIRPVGAAREIPVDVRIVAATHVNLDTAVREGRFRSDLYFRLIGDRIMVPPLRARIADIPSLAARFIAELGHAHAIAVDALAALAAYHWPGNVRELRHVIRRAVVIGGGDVIHARDLLLIGGQRTVEEDMVKLFGRPYQEIEREVLLRTVARHGGNRTAAAHELQIPKSTLCEKVKRYGGGGK
jgi:two-component system response regulator HupR/HoxA